MKYFTIYLVIVNILAVIITCYDKRAAKVGRRRIRERTLLLISALGGAPAMYLTMLVISHKTRKPKFMLGIPLIFIAELTIVFVVLRYGFQML